MTASFCGEWIIFVLGYTTKFTENQSAQQGKRIDNQHGVTSLKSGPI